MTKLEPREATGSPRSTAELADFLHRDTRPPPLPPPQPPPQPPPPRQSHVDEQPGLEVVPPARTRQYREDQASRAPEVYWNDKDSREPGNFTFYREGTPTPPEYPEDGHMKTLGAGSGDMVEREIPLYEEEMSFKRGERMCGLSRRLAWAVIIGLAVLAIILGIGLGVGVGFQQSHYGGASTNPPSSPVPNGSPTSPSDSSSSSGSSTVSPTSTPTSTACRAANGTTYDVPGSDKKFLRLCGVDFSGFGEAVDLSHLPTDTFEECMNNCAGTTACTGCGWGVLEGDTGTAHACWMKNNLQKSHKAAQDWYFAVLQGA